MVQSERKAADVCPSDPPFVKNLGRSDFAKCQSAAISAEPGAPQATAKKPAQGLLSRKSSWHHLPVNGEPTIDRREQYTMSLAFLHPPTTITNMHEAPEENHSPGASFVLDEPNSFLIS